MKFVGTAFCNRINTSTGEAGLPYIYRSDVYRYFIKCIKRNRFCTTTRKRVRAQTKVVIQVGSIHFQIIIVSASSGETCSTIRLWRQFGKVSNTSIESRKGLQLPFINDR